MSRLYRTMLLMLAVVATVSGCAQPPRYDEIAHTLPPLSPGQARIYAYRGPNVYEGLERVPILLNGRQAGAVGPGQVTMIDVMPGPYAIEAATQGLVPNQVIPADLAPGQTIYVKVTTVRGLNPQSQTSRQMNTHVAVLMDPAVAQQEIAGLAFISSERKAHASAG